MTFADRIETLSKLLTLLSDFAKLAGVGALATMAIAALANPAWVRTRLDDLGVEIKEINAPGLKIVAKETVKAGANTLQIAEALTEAEIKLRNASSGLGKVGFQKTAASGHDAEIAEAVKKIQSARAVLDEQSKALESTGKHVGVTSGAPAKGWLFVGYFDEAYKLKKPSVRIASADGVRISGTKVLDLILQYDAPVVSDGDNCASHDVSEISPPDLNAPEREYAIIRAGTAPLKVIATSACPARSGGMFIFAQIEVPKDRVRFSKLSLLSQ